MKSLPDIQRGQDLINLLLSLRIIVDACLEATAAADEDKSPSPLHISIWWCSEGRFKNLTFRFSRSPYATAM